MHVSECVDAMRYVVEHADDDLNTYNLGTRATTSVTATVDMLNDELGVDSEYTYNGGHHATNRSRSRNDSDPDRIGNRPPTECFI